MRFSPKWFYIFQSPVDERMYVGQTVRSTLNEKYFGSGIQWSKHIQEYGQPTLIFSRFCNKPEEFQSLLSSLEQDYPKYWETELWFNSVPETPEDSMWTDSEIQSINGRKGGAASKFNGALARNLEKMHSVRTKEQLAKGGSVVSNRRVVCPECGKLSSPGALGMHRKFKHLGGKLSQANIKQLAILHNKDTI